MVTKISISTNSLRQEMVTYSLPSSSQQWMTFYPPKKQKINQWCKMQIFQTKSPISREQVAFTFNKKMFCVSHVGSSKSSGPYGLAEFFIFFWALLSRMLWTWSMSSFSSDLINTSLNEMCTGLIWKKFDSKSVVDSLPINLIPCDSCIQDYCLIFV